MARLHLSRSRATHRHPCKIRKRTRAEPLVIVRGLSNQRVLSIINVYRTRNRVQARPRSSSTSGFLTTFISTERKCFHENSFLRHRVESSRRFRTCDAVLSLSAVDYFGLSPPLGISSLSLFVSLSLSLASSTYYSAPEYRNRDEKTRGKNVVGDTFDETVFLNLPRFQLPRKNTFLSVGTLSNFIYEY